MRSLADLSELVDAFAAELDVIHRALRRFGVSRSDAEDVAQEVFLVMWRRLADYDRARPLRPWVIGIAFRVAQDHRRRARREVPAGLIDPADQRLGPDQELAAQRTRALVRSALGALSDKQRILMILHDLDGVAMPEIAGVLSEPLSTLYSRLDSARRSFAKVVRRLGQRHALLVPGLASPGAWLALEKAPDPAPPGTRARLLRRARALVAGAPPDGAGWTRRDRVEGPSLASAGRLAVGGGGLAVVAAALLVLLGARPTADARAPRVAVDDCAAERPPSPALAGRARPTVTLAATLPAALAALPGPARAAAQLRRGLVGYWRFDDGAGSPTARDSSAQASDCLLRGLDAGSRWVEGRLGGAIDLDGRGWLECPGPRFGRAPDLTVAAWVKRTRPQRGLRVLATRQLGSGPRDYFFFGFADDQLSVASHVWNGTLRHPLPRAPGLAPTRGSAGVDHWIHLAAVHRDGRVQLYIDGALVAERRSYRGRTVSAATPLLIGAGVNGPDPDLTTQRLIAAIDELVVYDRALDDREIAALAEGVQPPLQD